LTCEIISDEMVDLFAMDKLRPSDEFVSHLNACPACRDRLEEAREWAAEIRKLRGGTPRQPVSACQFAASFRLSPIRPGSWDSCQYRGESYSQRGFCMFSGLSGSQPQPSAGDRIVVHLNAKLRSMDRGDHFEAPLDAALRTTGRGAVSGAGTRVEESGEINSCDIELLVRGSSDEVLQFIVVTLEDLGAPKGSMLIVVDSGVDLPLGKTEGIAVYLNGTDLPAEIYETCDSNFISSEFSRLLGTQGRVLSYWQGPTETAFYMYGPSSASIRACLERFLAAYPLCQKCRITQIA
jgi:hypothetical protein